MARSSARFLSFATNLVLVSIQLVELVQASPNPPSPICNGPLFTYGNCSNLNINYIYSPGGVSQYVPSDQNHFNVAQSTDLASIESAICSTLGSSTCGASPSIVNICWEIFWLHSGLSGSQGVQTWNSLITKVPGCGASSTTTVTVYVSATSNSNGGVSTSFVTSSIDTTTTVVNTDLTTVIVTSTLQPGTSSTAVTSTTTTHGTKTSTTDTTLTRTITSFTSATTQDRSASTSSSDPFSMNGTPFIYNTGASLGTNLLFVVFAFIVSILASSLILNFG